MGCLNITPLVLSDTFNTWFERTNELITGINSFYIRGLSASNRSGTDIEAFVIQEDQDCFYTIDLKTGPFLGFITSGESGYDSAIHGTGDYVNPYNLVLKFDGSEPTIDKDLVATGDYLLVSDTDDNSLVKKTTADAFLTRLNSGSKISVNYEDNGSWTIDFVPLFFTPTISTDIPNYTEIGKEYTTVSFTIDHSQPSDIYSVAPAFTQILPLDNTTEDNISSNLHNITLGGTGTTSVSSAQFPLVDDVDWFSINRTQLVFQASITSDSQSIGGFNFIPENVVTNVTRRFAWRFFGFSNTTEFDQAGVQSYLNGSPNLNMTISAFSRNDGNAGSSRLVHNPNTRRTLTWPSQGYHYFLHTCSPTYTGSNSDDFGFNALWYDLLGAPSVDWATEIGIVTYDPGDGGGDREYRVYRSGNLLVAGTQIDVGNDD